MRLALDPMAWRLAATSVLLLSGCLADVEEPPAVLTQRMAVVFGHVGRADGTALAGIAVTLAPDPAGRCPASSEGTVHAPSTLVTTTAVGEYRAIVGVLVDARQPFPLSCVRLTIAGQAAGGAPDTARSLGPVGFSPASPTDSIRGDVIYPVSQPSP